jgi:hypothetical protein
MNFSVVAGAARNRAGRARLAMPIAAAVRETNWRLFITSLLGHCPFWFRSLPFRVHSLIVRGHCYGPRQHT